MRRVRTQVRAQVIDAPPGRARLDDARAAEDNHGVPYAVPGQHDFGLEVVQLQAGAAGIVVVEETDVLIGLAVAGVAHDGPHPPQCLRIILRGLGFLAGQGLAAPAGMGRTWDLGARAPGAGIVHAGILRAGHGVPRERWCADGARVA